MKRYALPLILLALALATAFTIIDQPRSYALAPLNEQSMNRLASLQEGGPLTARDCAAAYLFFRTDYEKKIPARIEVSSKTQTDGAVRVSFRDDCVADDSISNTIDRIYLRQDMRGHWVVERHEWSHKGRGHWGWTTEPTT